MKLKQENWSWVYVSFTENPLDGMKARIADIIYWLYYISILVY